MVENFKPILGIKYFNYFFFFRVGGARRRGTPTTYCIGKVTFGMPSKMGSVVSVPSGIGLEIKKPGVATLVCCSWGSLALMTHLGTKKLLEIGM